jgi:hypothetical protein
MVFYRSKSTRCAVAAIIVGLWVPLGCDPGASRLNKIAPEEAGKEWAAKLKIPLRGVSCAAADGDGDGYVSCVLAIDTGDGAPRFQGLQCAELGSTMAGGCKPDSKNAEVKPWE